MQLLSASQLISQLALRMARAQTPVYVVALDGRSGAGKSTLAQALSEALGARVIGGDDLFAGGVVMRDDSPAQRAASCIDWQRQREVLAALRRGERATWRAFDWDAFDGCLCDTPSWLDPGPLIVLEGVYSARPELGALIDLRVLLDVPEAVRQRQLLAREGEIGPWERQWHEAEAHYFEHIAPPSWFDVIVSCSP